MEGDKLEFNEVTFKQLLAKNKSLSDELQQCVQDKEFVWNLWKEMQVTNPNTTNIINSVIEREKEKSDIKAAKVLTVLQEKDQQINILQEISADLQIQLKHTNERISELLVRESDWKKREDDFNIEMNHLKKELDGKGELQIDKDKLVDDIEKSFKQQITELEEKVREFSAERSALEDQINVLNENLININKENEVLKGNIISKDENLLSIDVKLDAAYKEKEMLIGENEVYKTSMKKLKASTKKKTKEVEEIREYWENKVNKNLETINEQHERIEQLQQEILSQQKELRDHSNCNQLHDEHLRRITEQTILIEKLEKLQDESQNVFAQQQATFETELNLRKKTIKNLKKKVLELQTEPRNMGNKENTPLSPIKNIQDENNDAILTSSPLTTNNWQADIMPLQLVQKGTQTDDSFCSVSILENNEEESSEFKARDYQMLANLVKSMESELQTTRSAHKKRLQRYKFLEENCYLLRQQLATYDDATEKKKDKIIRASAKSLRREDSKSVWNELEYYRQEYENFKFEKPKLNEKLDQLMVEKAHYDTLIGQMKLEADDFKKILYEKDREIEQKEIILLKNMSKMKCLQDELSCCYEEKDTMQKDHLELQAFSIKAEKSSTEKLHILTKEIESLKASHNPGTKDVNTQTDLVVNNVEELIHNAIIDVIPNKESSQELTTSCKSVASQMVSEETQCVEKGSLTDETISSIEKKEHEKLLVTKENDKLKFEYEQLHMSKTKLLSENDKLKLKQSTLTQEIKKVMESEKAIRGYVGDLENTNEKLKSELLENVQTLKQTTDALEKKSKEVEECSQELNIALSNEQKGKNIRKKKLKEIKSFEKQLDEATAKCSQLSFQVKTLSGENEILSDKQKTFQARVGKLEKDLIQKKTLYDELKSKFEDLKNESNQKESIVDNLKLKLNSVSEREKNKKLYTEELKIKVDTLLKEKCTLQESISLLRAENCSKTELLQKTQRLCHQAEIAINEIELGGLKKMEENNPNIIHQRCVKQVDGFKSVVKDFSEALILKISENRKKMLEVREKKKKEEMEARQNSLLRNKSSSIACSILGMSTQDLVEFMNEDMALEGDSLVCDNEIRNKLGVILKKEIHFEKVLTQFLLDLVKYNENLYQQQTGI